MFYYRNWDGSLPRWGVVYMTVTGELNELKLDFGPETSPGTPGYTSVDPRTNNGLISWSSQPLSANRDITHSINRDLVFNNVTTTLNVKLKNGLWNVVVGSGDTNWGHDEMTFKGEGVIIAENVTTGNGVFSDFSKDIELTDEEFNLEISDNGGSDANWVLNKVIFTFKNSLSIVDFDDPNQIVSIYPNPTTDDLIHVDFNESSRNKSAQIGLYTITGKLVKQQDIESLDGSESPIDVSDLPRGIYIIKINVGTSKTINRKVIVN